MEVWFRSNKLAKQCSTERSLARKWGAECGKRVALRLTQLAAAPTLADMRGPGLGRCHELAGGRKGQLSLDLVHPLRLLFEPDEPVPRDSAGGLVWAEVASVVVLDIEDTH